MKWPGPTDGNDDRNYNAGMNHSQSMETLIHRKLSRRRCNALLEYIGHSPVEQKHWRYRLFTQYADQGALDEVISYYRQHVREAPEWGNPEAFIWYCFQNLARAARVMECGDETLPEVSGWRSVVHRGIKPGNVLLQSPATYWTCSTVAAVPDTCEFTCSYVYMGSSLLTVVARNSPTWTSLWKRLQPIRIIREHIRMLEHQGFSLLSRSVGSIVIPGVFMTRHL